MFAGQVKCSSQVEIASLLQVLISAGCGEGFFMYLFFMYLFYLFKISLPRAEVNCGNCFSMSPATKTKNKVIFTMIKYTKNFKKIK